MLSEEPKILSLPSRSHSAKSVGQSPSGGGFYLGAENKLVETAMQWVLEGGPDGEGPRWNPLTFYGPSGCGKTHVLYGIFQKWKERHKRSRVLYFTGAEFYRQFHESLQMKTSEDFRLRLRSAPLWIVDQFEDLRDKPAACDELLYALDESLLAENIVIFGMNRFPGELPSFSPRLLDRLIAGVTVPIAPPGLKTRAMMIRELAAHFGVPLSQTLLTHLAKTLDVNYPSLSGFFSQLVLTGKGQKLDAKFIRGFLKLNTELTQPSLEEILRQTAKFHTLKQTELKGKTRRSSVVRARAIGMYLSRQLTDKSLKEIGRFYGNRDHKTVAHHCEEMETKITQDAVLRGNVFKIRELIAARPKK